MFHFSHCFAQVLHIVFVFFQGQNIYRQPDLVLELAVNVVQTTRFI